jgi:uncharacterized membrane protein YfcA
MLEGLPYLMLYGGVLAGAVVSGLAGFAFSAVAGGMLLHVLPAGEAVPLMMACSIVVQGASVLTLRRSMRWGDSLPYIVGGIVGIPPSLYLLDHVGARMFRACFGIFLAAYATYMFFRPSVAYLRPTGNRFLGALVGFFGGLIGGFTAMPGAIVTIWCDLHSMAKDEQRGLVQPFIAAMQIAALALMLSRHALSLNVAAEFAFTFPALVAGTALGIALFGKVNDAVFRRVVFVVLFVAGFGLAL